MSTGINSYKYENEIDFSINDVKNAIKDILEKNRVRFLHKEKDINDVFNTYKFDEIKCSYNITLIKVSENSTKITLTCSERGGGFTPTMASLESYVSEFMNILSKKLSGATDEEMKKALKENNSDGTASDIASIAEVISFIVGAGFVLYLLFC